MRAHLFGTPTTPPLFLAFRSSRTFIILTVASAVFTDIFAYGIVVPVFPFALTTRASIPESEVQRWTSIFLAVYGAALLVASPIFGYLADRNDSRQVPFLGGLLALGASTAMLCVGNSIAIFAAGRVLQGISAAVVWCTGLALLVDAVGPEEIGVAMGYVGLSMSLAVMLAPLLAGVVFETAGYYAVYAMCFGLIGVDIVMRIVMIEPRNARKWLKPEVIAVPESSDPGKADDKTPTVEAKNPSTASDSPTPDTQTPPESSQPTAPRPSPLPSKLRLFLHRLPPVVTLLSSRRILAILWACTMASSLMTSFDAILPLFVRDIFSWSSLGAGLIFLPIVIASFLGPWIGGLADRYGPRWLATSGFILATPFLVLLRLVDHNSISQKVMLCAFLVVIGLGLNLALVPLMAEITYAVQAKAARAEVGAFGRNGAYAQAYSLFNVAWAAGSMIGPLLAGLIVEAHGWSLATLILGIVSLVTAVPTAIWTGGSWFKERRRGKMVGSGVEGGDAGGRGEGV
ncbi:MFS transporter like protein [Zymoseptoria brevis]|uniref:MFS transporter like protein n=1 Tax=Zymoseptoria brevis TaxID=1047168 RepID=A0A0F4GNI8_9PEZI|nr:MFS transporter like protein [Zymoseptoria brevis]